MTAQRSTPARTVCGTAEDLPFADASFDGAMAVNTVHHWSDPAQGLREMRRVSRGVVAILTSDPDFPAFWLNDFFPELAQLDDRNMPPLTLYGENLGSVTITPVPVPHDCADGFLYAYWRRPSAYLDPKVRAAMSSFHAVGDVSAGVSRLREDLETGVWDRRYGHLRGLETLDCGYRLIVAG